MKLSSLFLFPLYEKCIPNIFTGIWSHFRFRGLFLLFGHFPSQIAFVFLTFKERPAILPNSSTIFSALSSDAKSALKRVVSSANCESLISFS